MSRLGVEHDIEAWELRCAAFAKVSDHIAQLLGRALISPRSMASASRRHPAGSG
jgi:hypothetical protein